MGYHLRDNETLTTGIVRIILEQIAQAMDQLEHLDQEPDEAVHDVRKRFKKIRAVLRLVRDEIGEECYQAENVCFRDLGRKLAPVRDSAVNIETLNNIVSHFEEELAPNVFQDIRLRLIQRHNRLYHEILYEADTTQEILTALRNARLRLVDWQFESNEFSVLYDGIKRVYKRGRNALKQAYKEPSPEHFHEWRKRVKYLWYHVRLLQEMWPQMLSPLADQIHNLSDYLGDEHDLSVLQHLLTENITLCPDEAIREVLFGLITRRRLELHAAARPGGERLYVEKPGAFTSRMAAYWQIWQNSDELERK